MRKKLLSMGFRLAGEDGWQFTYYCEGDQAETVVTDITDVREECKILEQFAMMQQSPEEKAQAEADKKIEELLTLITSKADDEEKLKLIDIYPPYRDGEEYSKDDPIPYVRFSGKLYKIISAAFTSQPDWTPDVAKSLFVEVLPPGTIGEWKQPTGAHDAYQIGDRVIFEGWVWCSIINNNTWSPSAYPQGWEKEREV